MVYIGVIQLATFLNKFASVFSHITFEGLYGLGYNNGQ